MLKRFHIRLSAVMAVSFTLSICTLGQSVETPELKLGKIWGTVTDANGDIIPGATVVLEDSDKEDSRTLTTAGNGFFEFDRIKPGSPYRIDITAKGLEEWTSPAVTLEPNQVKILNAQLRIPTVETTVEVTYNPVEVATEQVKSEEKQRVLGGCESGSGYARLRAGYGSVRQALGRNRGERVHRHHDRRRDTAILVAP